MFLIYVGVMCAVTARKVALLPAPSRYIYLKLANQEPR